jgi:replicative DNA helicase
MGFSPSRALIDNYARVLGDDKLHRWSRSDIFWDRVVAFEPAGEEEVFDLTVPGPSCWLADGIVSHNSGQIEQDADLVMFIYRDEYYFPETTEHPGEAELIIAKHRNGGLGTVNVSFQGEFPRFLGLSRQEV